MTALAFLAGVLCGFIAGILAEEVRAARAGRG
jgi:hypothetical protein